jgi:PKHD-type hydroxylase
MSDKMQISITAQQLMIRDLREFIASHHVENVFTPEECDKIVSLWCEDESIKGGLGERGTIEKKDTRSSQIQWLSATDPKNRWIMVRLLQACITVNEQCYGFNLNGMIDAAFQLTRYKEGDEYGWHLDIGSGQLRYRKLSFSVQLSAPEDYEGGNLEIAVPPSNACKTKGTIITFPSFATHRVTPVTSGVRYALVGWVTGPPWR